MFVPLTFTVSELADDDDCVRGLEASPLVSASEVRGMPLTRPAIRAPRALEGPVGAIEEPPLQAVTAIATTTQRNNPILEVTLFLPEWPMRPRTGSAGKTRSRINSLEQIGRASCRESVESPGGAP